MRALLLAASVVAAPSLILAQTPTGAAPERAVVVPPGSVTWGTAPAALPVGAKAAVLEGDPAQPGLFTLRLWLPDGYTIPPHFHPAAEHVTVIQGTKHFARAKGVVVLQLHGTGPWGLTYVNPADDPRRRPTP